MYITDVLTKTKSGKTSHTCTLLRESYRENGKVKSRTIHNLTHCNPDEVDAMRLALKHKKNLASLISLDDVTLKQGLSVGAVWTVYGIAKQLGIEKALGKNKEGKLALWQVIARVIDQGSRLSAVRLAQTHAACDILGIKDGFNEDHLYKNLAWLFKNQNKIEKSLFNRRYKGQKPDLFLYDVTSSYFEGTENELANWGYNRDGKKGKKQVVVGLLCDDEGEPISVEVFTGNTNDLQTFGSQIKKVATKFGCQKVTFVGDRGMIKSGQIEDLEESDFNYITAITRPQIGKLLKSGVFQLSLFDKDICEIEHENIRYVLRRNPVRQAEISYNRNQKKDVIKRLVEKKNAYLTNHKLAKVEVAQKEIEKRIARLKLTGWLKIKIDGRTFELTEDQEYLDEKSKFDGCYVIKSNLPKEFDKQVSHDRYKDLIQVEQAFRTSKTVMLEMRPWYVHTEESTRGHALVVMLAYLIAHHLQKSWSTFDLTVKEGLDKLALICSTEMKIKGKGSCHKIPGPENLSEKLLNASNIILPKTLPWLNAKVVSRKKLQSRRSHQ